MNTISEFFYMGGYALYVWGSFGVTLVIMIIEPIMLRRNRTLTVRRIVRMKRLQQLEENRVETTP